MNSVLAAGVLVVLLAAATIWDLRTHSLPAWLTFGGIVTGLLMSATGGPGLLLSSGLGAVAGGAALLPFVLLGGFGIGDAFLLAAVGAWQGWRFLLVALFWTAVCGGALAVLAKRQGKRAFPYVPAIALGSLVSLALTQI